MRYAVIFSAFVSIIGLVLLANFWLPINDLIDCPRPTKTGVCQPVGAVVAISGGDTIGRTSQSVKLYKLGWSNKLILSGNASDEVSPSNAIVMRQQALKLGVPKEAIIVDELADNTKQNAVNVSKILAKNKITSIILVTSPYHQRRAFTDFRKHCPNVKILNFSNQADKDWPTYWWLNWNSWRLILSELAKNLINNFVYE